VNAYDNDYDGYTPDDGEREMADDAYLDSRDDGGEDETEDVEGEPV
jgi:hypothetical protein